MRRSWHIWIAFGLCLAVVLAAMGWISLKALDLDRTEAEARRQETLARHQEALARRQETAARRQAALEQNVQLALWRMEFDLLTLVPPESARPYFAYSTFLPVDRAYRQMFNDRSGGEVLWPSPLLQDVSPHILVYFQFEPDGRLTSPRVPPGSNADLAVPQHISEEAVGKARRQLDHLATIVDREKLLAMLPDTEREPVPVVIPPLAQTPEQRIQAQEQRRNDLALHGRGYVERGQRNMAVTQNASAMFQAQVDNNRQFANFSALSTDVGGVLMTPCWIEGNLILARRIAAGGREYVQGCLLDWPGIRTWLEEEIADLLPEAELLPVTTAPVKDESRVLFSLPVRLIPGEVISGWETASREIPLPPIPSPALDAAGPFSPIRLSLLVAWSCVLLAAVAVAVLLWGVIRLSERRAAFVSAVTHELRTPLTTFHMYTEMLAEGMVPDPRQQQSYFNTLRSEASRLSHLVENVLSYARLERGRADGRIETLAAGRLVEPIEDRLADRARQAGMELLVEGDDATRSATVRANPSAVEQILFNLVDNAGKYAATASDKRIHLALDRADGVVELRVRDHGPGISRSAARRLFHSFSKSAHEAAHSAPGVGLGLALSRRLARDMGGQLHMDPAVTDGACFVLTLLAL